MIKKFARLMMIGLVFVAIQTGNAFAYNLVINGGFETGDFSGWTLTNVTSDDFVLVADTGTAHSETYEALLGKSGSMGMIFQTITTNPGQQYSVNFFVANDSPVMIPGTGQIGTSLFQALWNGQVMYPNLINTPAFGYTEYSYSATATDITATIAFAFQHDASTFHLDDVAANPTPIPASLLLLGSGLIGVCGFKKRK